jgi:hypothetical protein
MIRLGGLVAACTSAVLLQSTFASAAPQTPASPAASVQSPPSNGGVPVADADVDEAAPQPLEPDFTIVNLPTTLRLPLHKLDFRLTHRFNGNLREGSFGFQASTLFGLDEGAAIGLELRYAPVHHLEVVVHRTNISQIIQFTGKYDGWHEGGRMPVSISAIGSIEGATNFEENYAPALAASISRTIGKYAAVYAVPLWVHNSAAASGVTRDTGALGVGGRVRVMPGLFGVVEVIPRIGGYAPGDAMYSFAIEKRVGGHVFQLNFSNGQGTTFGQLARGGFPNSLFLGFNLSRKFY